MVVNREHVQYVAIATGGFWHIATPHQYSTLYAHGTQYIQPACWCLEVCADNTLALVV